MDNKVILFNPQSAKYNYRIPNSILSIASSIEGIFDYVIVDGNSEHDPLTKIFNYLKTGKFKYFASTVMPGPQLKQAIPFTDIIKKNYPEIQTIWGGYFASNQYEVVINSGFIDYIVYGTGEYTFPALLNALESGESLNDIKNLIYLEKGKLIKTPKDVIPEPDKLPPLPYKKLNNFYPIKKYLGKTWLGSKTIAYHSSYGCPFTCSFCAVVPIYNAKWKGKSAINIYKDIKWLKDEYGGNAIEFHDNNFFVSEKRTLEFSKLILKENMRWWGEARIDTVDKYKDDTLKQMRDAGCVMIFFGAETGNDMVLKKMNKGGTQSGDQIKRFAERMAKFDIIPEYSFVLGMPLETEKEVEKQIDEDIEFIREIKRINPATEIIIYLYSPVPTQGSELFENVKKKGFIYPEKLYDWISPEWENFDLRKNPLTPWLKPEMIDKIKNFETVLNAYHPTVSDIKLTPLKIKIMKKISSWRYNNKIYDIPYEIKFLQSKWLKYRQPEIEGF